MYNVTGGRTTHFIVMKLDGMLFRFKESPTSRDYLNIATHKTMDNTIIVNTGHSSAVDFSMTAKQKKELFHIGFQTAMEVIPLKTKVIVSDESKKALAESKKVVNCLP